MVELKPLLDHVKYAFLGEKESLPVIISSKLNESQEEKLVAALKKYKSAIGWTIADIKGINPSKREAFSIYCPGTSGGTEASTRSSQVCILR